MSDEKGVPIGTVGWFDLTVEDAEGLRDFYGEVAGWSFELVPMEGYDDYLM
ncbi:VOC family protein, partial [bacterium]|nr:VOC family protein [bacterium]